MCNNGPLQFCAWQFRNSNKLQEDIFKGRFLHCVVSDNSIEGSVVQILDHKYVWTSVWVKSDLWGLEPLSRWSIIGHIVACVCCHEITLQPFDLTYFWFISLLICVPHRPPNCGAFCTAKKGKPAMQNFLKGQSLITKIFFCISKHFCQLHFRGSPSLGEHVWPSVHCTVSAMSSELFDHSQRVNEWLRSGLRRNTCDANAKSSEPRSGLVKPRAIHNHAGKYVTLEFSIRETSQLCVCPSIFVSISLCLRLSCQALAHTLLTLLCDATHHSNYF